MPKFVRLLQLSAILLSGFLCSVAYPIDLLKSYQIAQDNSAELAAALASSQAEILNKDIAIADLYPTVTLEASSRQTNKYAGAKDTSLTSGGITIVQPIWSESLHDWLDGTKEQATRANLQYQKAQTSLFKQVVDAYFDVLAAQDRLDTTQSEIASISTLRDFALVRRNAGVGTETDLRIAEARLALADAAVIIAENAVDNAMLTLSELLGHRPARLSALQENVSLPPLKGDLQHWIDVALSNNIDLLIQQSSVIIASHGIGQSSAASDLQVDLSARFNNKFSGSDMVKDHTSAMLSITKSFSVKGRATNQRKQAVLRYEAALNQLQSLKSRTVTLATGNYRNAISLIDQIEALQLAVQANEDALEITQSNYDVGVVTSLAVLDAQQDVFEVQRDLLKSRYDYFQTLIALEQIAGTLDLTDLEVLNQLLQ